MRGRDDSLEAAISLACWAHKGQPDKSGDPYIHHPLAVMQLAYRAGMSDDAIKAAVLHDVVEDSPRNGRTVTTLEIHDQFGSGVAVLVGALTHLPTQTRVEYIGDIGPKGGMEAVKLKLLDITHNTLPTRLAKLTEAERRRLVDQYEQDRFTLDRWRAQHG